MVALSLVALACMAAGFVGMVSVIALWALSFGSSRAPPKGATKPSQEADSDLDGVPPVWHLYHINQEEGLFIQNCIHSPCRRCGLHAWAGQPKRAAI